MIEQIAKKDFIPVMPLDPRYAYAYIKYQYLDKVYGTVEGLEKGTSFPELYMPYKYGMLRGGDTDDTE